MIFNYFIKRLFLIIPTLLIIITINFFIMQTAPGGPVEKIIYQITHPKISSEVTSSSNNAGSSIENQQNSPIQNSNLGNQARNYNYIEEELSIQLNKELGFDLPLFSRYILMLKKLIKFDFGNSFYQDKKVVDILIEKMPVSISLGLWSLIITYLIAIPLGITKAIKSGSKFDNITTILVVMANALPSFLVAIGLIILFCGGNFLNLFPIKGLVSGNFAELNWWQKIIDYLWHLFLPILAMTIGGIASITIFCKNNFLEELNKPYIAFAISKGASLPNILYSHILPNALLLVIASLPAQILTIFFTSSMLIEVTFSLDGLGLLGYEAIITRDYPIIFATIFIFSLIGLIANIVSDICYHLIDPRLDFAKSRS